MPARIDSDSDSSEDDYYDNFKKYKQAKAKATALAKTVGKGKTKEASDKLDKPFNESNAAGAGNDSIVELTEDIEAATTDLDLENLASLTSTTKPPGCFSPTAAGASVIDLSIDEEDVPSQHKMPKPSNSCTINISCKGQLKMFICDMDEPIGYVIEDYAGRTGADPSRVILYTKQYKRIDPKDTPRGLGFTRDGAVELDAFEDLEQTERKMIKLKYQMKGRKAQTARVLPETKFATLKEMFCTENGLDLAKTQFILDSERITDTDTPESLGLEDDDCIDVYVI